MKKLQKLRAILERAVLAVNGLGMLVCFAMVFLVTVNVIVRKLSGARLSIPGSSELSAYGLVVICMLGIPALQIRQGHIQVEMLTGRFPPRLRNLWLGAVRLVELLVCGLLTWGSLLKTRMFLETGAATDVLNLPKWPFALLCLVGFLELSLLTATDAAGLFLAGTNSTGRGLKHGDAQENPET